MGSLAACGGGGGGGDDTSPSTTDDTTTVSGTVESPGGTTIGQTDWLDRGGQLLASVISPATAEVSGLKPVPDGTPVMLVRLDNSGNIAETLAQTDTNADGEFSFDTSATLGGSTVIVAGTGDNQLRGAPSGQDSTVNPVSEAVVRDIVKRVSNDQASFDDFDPSEVAATVESVERDLEAQGKDLSVSVSNAVDTVDTVAGQTVTDNLDAAETDSAPDFAGDKHLVILDGELNEPSTETAIYEAATSFSQPSITDQGNFDISGTTFQRQRISRDWNLGDPVKPDFFSGSSTESVDTDPIDLLLRDDGTFAGAFDDSNINGVRSTDGKLFAAVTRDSLLTGAAQRQSTPSDLTASFNTVAFTFYADQSDNNSNVTTFRPGQVGAQVRERTRTSFACSSGQCDITIDEEIAASDEKTFVQSGPALSREPDARSTPQENFTLSSVALSADGALDGSGETRTSGFIAPGNRLMSFSISGLDANSGLSGGFPYVTQYIGVPVPGPNQTCDNATFEGTYRAVELLSEHTDSADKGTAFREIDHETLRYKVTADGQGTFNRDSASVAKTSLEFNESGGAVSATVTEESLVERPVAGSYSVASNCTLSVLDGSGAISPDGEVVLLGLSDAAAGFGSDKSASVSVVIAIRQSGGGD